MQIGPACFQNFFAYSYTENKKSMVKPGVERGCEPMPFSERWRWDEETTAAVCFCWLLPNHLPTMHNLLIDWSERHSWK